MGNEFAPGKRTLVQAGQIASAPDIGQTEPTPGKQTLVQQTYGSQPSVAVGNAAIDSGPSCEANPAASECFLVDKQRQRLEQWIMFRVGKAGENYKGALADLKVAELVKKPDDLGWVTSMVLDLIGGHLMVTVGAMLKGLRAAGISKLNDIGFYNAMTGVEDSVWQLRAMSALHAVTPGAIDAASRSAFLGVATPQAKSLGKKLQNHDAEQHTTVQTSFLDGLRDNCDAGFERLLTGLIAGASDADLVLAYESFDPDHHSTGVYVKELKAKLKRFMDSGVPDIGEKRTQLVEGHLETETRVVLVEDIMGKQTPWYTTKLSDYMGKGMVSHGEAKLSKPVPDEFASIAVAASEARYGAAPVIDDGYVSMLKQQGVNISVMRAQMRGGAMVTNNARYAQTSPFAQFKEPPAPGLPAGSVFDDNKQSQFSPADEQMARAMGLIPDKKP